MLAAIQSGLSLSPAATAPRLDTRPAPELVLSLARRAGPSIAGRFPWRSYDEVIQERVRALLATGSGNAFSDAHSSTWLQMLERSGWRTVTFHAPEELEEAMERTGGWWDPAYRRGAWRRLAPRPGHRINITTAALSGSRRPVVAPRADGQRGREIEVEQPGHRRQLRRSRRQRRHIVERRHPAACDHRNRR